MEFHDGRYRRLIEHLFEGSLEVYQLTVILEAMGASRSVEKPSRIMFFSLYENNSTANVSQNKEKTCSGLSFGTSKLMAAKHLFLI
jgi:hypothetical protein